MLVTVFTPTYNRADLLPRLFESLCTQDCYDFEWLIVDDGSSDNTEAVVKSFSANGKFPIRYYQKENGGKHTAINLGLFYAEGTVFFIVDSDDYLTGDAIKKISLHYNSIKGNPEFAGVCGLKCYHDGQRVGGECDFGILDCNSLDFRYKHKVHGDMAEVIRTDVMREFPIPEFKGERFCPEALFFNRIAQKYKLRYFYERIYLCDYLPDGLTAKITKLRMQSPRGSMTCYSELSQMPIPFIQKAKAAINFWRFSFCSHVSITERIHQIAPSWIGVLPLGYVLHRIDIYKTNDHKK